MGRGGDRDQRLGAGLYRQTSQVGFAMFGDDDDRIGAADGRRVGQAGDDAADRVALGRGGQGNDGDATLGGPGTAHEVDQSAGTGDLAAVHPFGVDLSEQVDRDGRVDGDEAGMAARVAMP